VHSSNFFAPYLGLFYAHKLAVRLGKKTVFAISEDFVDTMTWGWIRTANTAFEKWMRRKTINKMEELVNKMVATSSLTFLCTPSVVSRYRSIAPNGVATLHSIHSLADIISEKDFLAKCNQIKSDSPLTIATICRHDPLKGLDFLIQAIAELKSRNLNVKVKIYGDGPITPMLKALTVRLGVGDRVSFCGVLSLKQIYRAVADVHLSAMPHRTNDFARAFYDSMVGGSPVIAFQTPASLGIVRDGVDGLTVPLDNIMALALAIERLHHDRSLLIGLAHNARTRALAETREIWYNYRAQKTRELFQKG